MKSVLSLAAALGLLASALAGCSYVKPMTPKLKQAMSGSDTIYVMPAKAEYRVKGFFTRRVDSAGTRRLSADASDILYEELGKVFPAATVIPVARGTEDSVLAEAGGVTVVTCDVKGFRRTVPREVVSETLDLLLMVPTFAMNLAFPIQPTSQVDIKVRKPGATKVVRLKHHDDVKPTDLEDLRFQIRILLEPTWRG